MNKILTTVEMDTSWAARKCKKINNFYKLPILHTCRKFAIYAFREFIDFYKYSTYDLNNFN